jgi:RNA-binding protein 23/39
VINSPLALVGPSVEPTRNMSGLDVEALLDSTANAASESKGSSVKDGGDRPGSHREDRDRRRDGSRDRDRRHRDRSADRRRRESRERRRDRDGDEEMKSPNGSHNSDRRRQKRNRDSLDADDRRNSGDFYRGGGHARTRSRSPNDDRYYRPGGNRRREGDDRQRERSPRREKNGRRRSNSPKRKSPTPPPTEDERDRRTVFVQQLAARLRTKELITFFEQIGPVKEAQIVKDRVSGRSKG